MERENENSRTKDKPIGLGMNSQEVAVLIGIVSSGQLSCFGKPASSRKILGFWIQGGAQSNCHYNFRFNCSDLPR